MALVLTDGIAVGSQLSPGWSAIVQLAQDDWTVATQTFARAIPGFASVDSLEQMRSVIEKACTQDAFVEFYAAAAGWDATPLLNAIEMPVLVTSTGDRMPLVPDRFARELAASLPNGRFAPGGDAEAAIIAFLRATFAETATSAPQPDADPHPHALRTVLFTDLVGHTGMMQRLGDQRGRDVLREHERITRDLLKQHGGAEIKTMGDGFMASFASVTRALDCAIALQRAFAAHQGEPLHVRVGLNAGEPIEEDGDLFGATVILASRIAARAGPGEILIPEPLRHLLAGKSYAYADRGEHLLKGFDDAVRLFEVRWRE